MQVLQLPDEGSVYITDRAGGADLGIFILKDPAYAECRLHAGLFTEESSVRRHPGISGAIGPFG
jgi:hypothetical protein